MSASAGEASGPAATSAASTARRLTRSQSSSTAAQSIKRKGTLNELSKVVGDAETAKEAASSASPFLLPFELLVEIFRCLGTFEVARVARVCRNWNVASKDARIWRHLSFSKAKRSRGQRLSLLGRRCGDTVESVDFANLSHKDVLSLVSSLMPSTISLRNIRCSEQCDRIESIRETIKLARLCPQLETLELHTRSTCPVQELLDESPYISKPKIVKIVASGQGSGFDGDLDEDDDEDEHQVTLFDHATTIAFEYNDYRRTSSHRYGRWMSIDSFARLFRNPALESLTVHGLCSYASKAFFISAPALKHLDLRWTSGLCNEFKELDAPSLRTLEVDVVMLPKFTSASVDSLSSLTVHAEGVKAVQLGRAARGAARISEHEGSMKLVLGKLCIDGLLTWVFFKYFAWPGLDEVTVELIDGQWIPDLVSIILARHVGALGGSESQYLDIQREAAWRLLEARSCGLAAEGQVAHELIAEALAFESDAGALPLCSVVQWTINVSSNVAPGIVTALQSLSNVHLKQD